MTVLALAAMVLTMFATGLGLRGRDFLRVRSEPAAILIGIFGLLPVLMSLQLSFQKSDLLSDETPWVGFDNYKKLASDPVFMEAVKHTVVYTALFVPGTMIVGLLVAAQDAGFTEVFLREDVGGDLRPVGRDHDVLHFEDAGPVGVLDLTASGFKGNAVVSVVSGGRKVARNLHPCLFLVS